MNKSKIFASLLIVLCVVGTLSFFVFTLPKSIKPTEPLAQYVTTEYSKYSNFKIWHKDTSIIAVNETQRWFLDFYTWTYNRTSLEVKKYHTDSWIINQTEKGIVFESENASDAIQFAFNHEGGVNFETGNYTLTYTLWLNSGANLDGLGTIFVVSKNFVGNFVVGVPENVTRVYVSNVHIDSTNWNP